MRGRPRESASASATSRYQGADGRWHARITVGRRLDGERDRRHITRKTKRELDTAIRELENARDSGQQPWLLENTTVEAWVEHWLDEILPLAVRWKTRSGYASHMRVHVIPFIGSARLTDLRPETLERLYRELLDQGRSSHVVHGVHRTLRSCLSEAVRRQRILTNPAVLARPPRVERTEIEPLNVDECRAILGAAQGRYNGARWSVALSLGLRQGEALGLLWDDVDLDAGVLRIRRALQRRTWMHGCSPRTRKVPVCGHKRGADCPQRRDGGLVLAEPKTRASRRSVALPPPLVAELRAHRATQLRVKLERANVWDHALDLVFSTDWGIPVDPAADQREWKQILRGAGVREVRLHDARHTAATLLLLQGVDIRTVMAIMGWTEMATAQRYVHAVDELRHEAARRMGAVLWDQPRGPAPYAGRLARDPIGQPL
jgi:integrase